MRIAFLGAVDFSRHCLWRVVACGGQVVGVLGLSPDRAARHSDYADLRPVATEQGLRFHAISDVNAPETAMMLRDWRPDVMFVFGWSQIISAEVRGIPPMGCIGTHPALLPRNRGRHPLIWALVEGLKESGLTFFYLDEGADSGDILWQGRFAIEAADDAGTLYDKVKALADRAIAEFLPELSAGTARRVPQDHSLATYWRKRGEADGEIQWSGSTTTAHNLVRALARPYVGAHCYFDGQRVVVWRARPVECVAEEPAMKSSPGTVMAVSGNSVDVRTGDGCLRLLECEFAGSKRPRVGDLLGARA